MIDAGFASTGSLPVSGLSPAGSAGKATGMAGRVLRQLNWGTAVISTFMHTPAKTLYILLADLHDTSPNTSRFVKRMEFLLESGVKAVGSRLRPLTIGHGSPREPYITTLATAKSAVGIGVRRCQVIAIGRSPRCSA